MFEDKNEHNLPTADGSIYELERRAMHWWVPLVILAVLGLLYAIGRWLGLREHLGELDRWIEGFGVIGPVVFVALYVAATVLGLPGSPMTAAAGALFGAVIGILTSLVASTVAATVSFLLIRHLAPVRLRERLAVSRSFQHLDRLVKRRGSLVVLATRMANLLPFAVVNYGFGLTSVRLRTYVICSLLGKIPGTVLLVVGVDIVLDAVRYEHVSWPRLALVVLVTLGLGLFVRRSRKWMEADN